KKSTWHRAKIEGTGGHQPSKGTLISPRSLTRLSCRVHLANPKSKARQPRDGCQLPVGRQHRGEPQSIPGRPTDEPSRLQRLAVTYPLAYAAPVCLKPKTSPWCWSLGRMQIFTRVSPACVSPGPCSPSASTLPNGPPPLQPSKPGINHFRRPVPRPTRRDIASRHKMPPFRT
ncbi:hypothetical protein GQ607_009896, partial [Colletotrichum asianum]